MTYVDMSFCQKVQQFEFLYRNLRLSKIVHFIEKLLTQNFKLCLRSWKENKISGAIVV